MAQPPRPPNGRGSHRRRAQCEKTIRGWTQAEIDDGLVDVDWDQQDRRVTALDRLREQLEIPGA